MRNAASLKLYFACGVQQSSLFIQQFLLYRLHDQQRMFAAVLDKPYMRIHAAANNTRQVDIR
jgi:spore cortex formation protein SpoVR/YcgB (stage V sporulation)